MFRLAGEFPAQHRILGGDTHRTGIEVTFAHHDAAFHYQWCRRKSEFIRAQQRPDNYIATGLHLPVYLHRDATAKAIQHQRLLGLRQAQLPWCAGMFDG